MASQSAIAEGNSVVTSNEINYEQKLFSHPTYKFSPQFPNTFGAAISLGTSQTPVTINIPPEVFNLSQSYLNYTVSLPNLTANYYIWRHLQCLAEISHMQFFTGSNQYIADVDNLQNYLDIVLKKELSLQEFMAIDETLNTLGTSNVEKIQKPAIRNSTMNTNGVVAIAPTYPSSLSYVEPGYFTSSAVGGAAVPNLVYNIQFPLKFIKNSVFSIDKDIYLAQTSYLKLYIGPINKVCYISGAQDFPSNNGPDATNKALYTGAATITNLQLMLAVENNQDLRTMIINKVATTGLTYMIPYIQSYKNNNNGGTQNISIALDQANGHSLLKVYHAPYNQQEQLDTAYDHCNATDVPLQGGGAQVNQKVQAYYTALNGNRIQDITINCTSSSGTPFLDYMSHRRMLRGSVIQNANIYQYNWFHCDDWTGFGSDYDQNNNGQLVSGVPLGTAPLTWSFVGITMNATATQNFFYHYTWFIFIKKLTMSPGTVTVN